jgi:hypothetical protein
MCAGRVLGYRYARPAQPNPTDFCVMPHLLREFPIAASMGTAIFLLIVHWIILPSLEVSMFGCVFVVK